MGISLPNNPGGLVAGLPNDPDDVLANDQAAASWSVSHEQAATGVHGVTGDIVGTTDSQSLSNKSISDSSLTDVTVAGTSVDAGKLGLSGNSLTVGNGTVAVKNLREDGVNTDTDTGAETLNDVQNSFADVDATNASLTFTVNAPGKYAVVCSFNTIMSWNSGAGSVALAFELYDGTNSSPAFSWGGTLPSGNSDLRMPVTLFHVFTFATAGSKTVKLRYKSATTDAAKTSVAYNTQAGYTSVGAFTAFRVAD